MQTLVELCDHFLSVSTRITSQDTRDHYWRSLRQFDRYLTWWIEELRRKEAVRHPTPEPFNSAPFGVVSFDGATSEVLPPPATTAHLTDDHLSGFMLWTVNEEKLVARTANQRAKQIRALWEWAARRRIVDSFPTAPPLREPELMPVAWKPPQLPILFDACGRQTGWIGPHRASTWWSALHWWEWDTGERAGATFDLLREHVDIDSRTARVPGRIRKGGCKSMIYRLRERTCELLAEMLHAPTDTGLVFDRNWKDDQSFYSRYKRVIDDAKLPFVKRKTGLQKMRVTVFTMIEAAGGNATAFARHSSRSVTEAYIDQTIIAACQKGIWPNDETRPDRPPQTKGWIGKLLGRTG